VSDEMPRPPDFEPTGSSDAKTTPKRVAFIKNRVRARVKQEEEDLVMTVPHLVVREVLAFEVMVIILALVSLFINAPLEWIANPEHTPNPAKAPWYFLGLQELLHYFPPIVAGVLIPALAVIALIAIPYFRVNIRREGLWKEKPKQTLIALLLVVGALSILLLLYSVYAMLVPTLVIAALMTVPYLSKKETGFVGWLGSRPLAWWIMTWFVVIVVVLTTVGTLFRGPEWSWTWPWKEIY
jgi:quinol---cytochrome c reductase cytochrome c subunit, bacillus type